MFTYTIIQQWLKDKVGIIIEDESHVGTTLKNGEIVAMLLDKYGLVSRSRLDIRQSNRNLLKQNYENWVMLRQWLSFNNFNLKEMEMINIVAGDNTTALKFLYQLYSKLNNLKSCSTTQSELYSKFQVTSNVDEMSNRQCQQLKISLLKDELKKTCSKYKEEQSVCKGNKITRKYKCDSMDKVIQDIDEFEKMHERQATTNYVPFRPAPAAEQKIPSLKSSSQVVFPEFQYVECEQKTKCKGNDSEDSGDEDTIKIIVHDLINQSKNEKKTCEALQLLKCQQYTLLENSKLMENLADKETTTNLQILLEEYEKKIMLQKLGELNSLNSVVEMEMTVSERGSMLDEKETKELQNREIHYYCKHIANDLIHIAHTLSLLNIETFPETVWQQWKQAFIKDEFCKVVDSIHDTFHVLDDNAQENKSLESSDVSILKLDYLECLAKADLYDYLKFERDWVLEDNGEYSLPVQEELGFIVTKLLKHLAAVPIPPQKPDLPPFESAFCLHGLPDKYHNLFKSILEANQVLFLTPEDLVNYCVSEYKKQTPMSEWLEDSALEEENSCIIRSLNSIEYVEEEDVTFFATKETQTPAVLPEQKYADISPAAVVGRKIAGQLIHGQEISSQLIVEALLSFLSKTEVRKGWVLVNFPNDFNDISQMESNLQGRFVPLNIEDNVESQVDYKSKLLPFIVNSEAPFVPYLSHCISIETNKKMKVEIGMVHYFYKHYNRYKQFRCHARSRLHKNVVQRILKFILTSTESESFNPGSRSSVFDSMDFGSMEESSSTESLFSEGESIEIEFENEEVGEMEEDTRSLCESDIFMKRFHFIDFDVPSEILSILGRLWRNLERRYLDILKSVFWLKRKENSTLLPFAQHVENFFKDAINLIDNKQQLVDTFQQEFNTITSKKRCCEDVKNLLHDKVFQLQLKLWEIADENQEVHRENVAKYAATLDWIRDHLIVTCKLYLIVVYIEIDRFSETMQILVDYYLLYLKKVPLVEKIVSIEKKQFDLGLGSSGLKDKSGLRQFITFKTADGFYTDFDFLYEQINSIFVYYENETDKYAIPKDDFSKMADDARNEMDSAVASEKQRISLRLTLIRRNFISEIEYFELWVTDHLNSQFGKMVARYEREIVAINKLCSVVKMAIEEETSLNRTLLLKEDKFSIVPQQPQSTSGELSSQSLSSKFTALTPKHIESLRKVFQSVAPDGIIFNSAFLFILEDMLVDNTHRDCLPDSWRMLKQDPLKNILHEIFGNALQYDWKDFLINTFEISYPNVSELKRMACVFHSLESEHRPLISLKGFNSALIWFEVDPNYSHEISRELSTVKQLLFKMFQVDSERMNYSQMLLHLCKDLDPIKGFAKALCLVSFQRQNLSEDSVESFHGCDIEISGEGLEENAFFESRPDSCIFHQDESENYRDTKSLEICYEDFEQVLAMCIQSEERCGVKYAEDLQKCLVNIQSQWTFPYNLCMVIGMIQSEPSLLTLLQSSHKFKSCVVSHIVDRYIYYIPDSFTLHCSCAVQTTENCAV